MILELLAWIFYGVITISVLAVIWHRQKKVDLAGDRRILAPKVHPIASFLCIVDEFCAHFFGVPLVYFKKDKWIALARECPHDDELLGDKAEFLELWETICEDIASSKKFSLTGRFLLNTLFRDILESRKYFIEYLIAHKEEVLKVDIGSPLIVTGSGRSGSTLMHNLLCQEENIRALQMWEVIWGGSVVPPVTEEDYNRPQPNHPKYQHLMEKFAFLRKVIPAYLETVRKSHPIDPKQYEEEVLMLVQAGLFHAHLPIAGEKYFKLFHSPEKKKSAYLYLKRFMQVLHSAYPPKSHWVLKGPFHSLFLPTLLEVFPTCKIVVTHRDMKAVVPSGLSLYENFVGQFFKDGEWDRYEQGKRLLPCVQPLTYRPLEFRKTWVHPEQIVDIHYPELMADPIGTVKKIYSTFGMNFSEKFQKNLEDWKAEHPQGKQGRHSYFPEKYGLTAQEIDQEFGEYHRYYGIHE